MNRIYSEVVVITPAEAAEILRTKNKVNRAIDRRLVARLAASMKAGEWKVNGECIVFAPDGTLLDGQNRLSAIVKSGVAITTCVMYNVPEDARATMDSGKKRTAADVLRFMGYKNSNIMAPIVRLAYIYDMLDREMNHPGVAQLVAHLTGGQGVVSSSLATRTMRSIIKGSESLLMILRISFCGKDHTAICTGA